VHDFDHLVHFWNPQPTCIDQRYEIQFSLLLAKCIPDIHIQENICWSSHRKIGKDILGIFRMDQLTICDFLQKRLNRKAPKSAASPFSLRRGLAPRNFFLFVYLKL
jgi:hypothetical protein